VSDLSWLAINTEKKLIVCSGNEILPQSFYYTKERIEKAEAYDTGGMRTVYVDGVGTGTVYVPGESGVYTKFLGYRVKVFDGEKLRFDRFPADDKLIAVLERAEKFSNEVRSDIHIEKAKNR
jgi:hypothetical protein